MLLCSVLVHLPPRVPFPPLPDLLSTPQMALSCEVRLRHALLSFLSLLPISFPSKFPLEKLECLWIRETDREGAKARPRKEEESLCHRGSCHVDDRTLILHQRWKEVYLLRQKEPAEYGSNSITSAVLVTGSYFKSNFPACNSQYANAGASMVSGCG